MSFVGTTSLCKLNAITFKLNTTLFIATIYFKEITNRSPHLTIENITLQEYTCLFSQVFYHDSPSTSCLITIIMWRWSFFRPHSSFKLWLSYDGHYYKKDVNTQ
jgi:hypothetical protein